MEDGDEHEGDERIGGHNTAKRAVEQDTYFTWRRPVTQRGANGQDVGARW